MAVLSNPTNPDSELSLKGMEVAARALGVRIRVQEVRDPTEFDKAFEATTREGARSLMVLLKSVSFLLHGSSKFDSSGIRRDEVSMSRFSLSHLHSCSSSSLILAAA